MVTETKLEMASSQSESLHLHLDESNITENETNTVKSTDLNVTWDYSDESSMETGNTTQGKRPRPLSDSENSDLYEHDERGSTKNTMPTNQPRLSHMGKIILASLFLACYSCGLSTATIEYSPLCVCLCVCMSVNTITQKIMR